jgi:hypothetical protein
VIAKPMTSKAVPIVCMRFSLFDKACTACRHGCGA